MLRLERWTEPLAESNCYLLGEAGRAVVIDPNDPRGPLERLEALGWTPERILLTHEHCDHLLGVVWIVRKIGTLMRAGGYEGTLHLWCHAGLIETIRTLCRLTLQKKFADLLGHYDPEAE